ncbi:hypothetical protein OIO90_004725 [Microbotryomycetes sp. JL221]|nr:hypothetical protein OIO90_004725 [Microbotryomycetes sp. JL221]
MVASTQSTNDPDGAAPTPPPADYPTSSTASPTALPATSIDDDLNKSTQRLLVETLWTAATYLLYSVGAYIGARLVKWSISWPFRFLNWTFSKLFWLIEKLFWIVAWITQYLALIAVGLIILFIIVTSIVLLFYKNQHKLNALQRDHPVSMKLAIEALYHVPLLPLHRLVWSFIYQSLVVLSLVRLGLNAAGVDWTRGIRTLLNEVINGRRVPRQPLSKDGTSSSSSIQATGASDPVEDRLKPIREAVERAEKERAERQAQRERDKEETEADNWTRQWQEQMVKEGLQKRAQQAAKGGTETEGGNKI